MQTIKISTTAPTPTIPTHSVVLVISDEQVVGACTQDVLAAASPAAAACCRTDGCRCRPRRRLQQAKPWRACDSEKWQVVHIVLHAFQKRECCWRPGT